MNPQPDHHSVRRITLPSGRSIEVVRFNDADGDATAGPGRTRSLHVCPDCGSNLVQPMAWSEATAGHWELVLECPNCTWTESLARELDCALK